MKRLRRAAWTAVAVLALALAALRVETQASAQPGAAAAPPAAAYGAALPRVPAPGFALADLSGQPVGLAAARGHVVVLSFIDLRSPDAATTAQLLRTFTLEIGPQAAALRLLVVNADPAATTAQISAWAGKQGLTGPWRLLTGSAATLQQVAAAYHIGSEIDGATLVHIAATYVIDPQGDERWVLSTAGSGLAAEAHAMAAAVLQLRA